MQVTTKAKAIKKGRRYYYSEPCELHPRSGRYTDNDECVDCSKGVGAIQKVDCQAENEAVTALEDSIKGNTPVKESETKEGENLGKTTRTLKELAADAKAEGLKTFEAPDKPCRKCGGIERYTCGRCIVCMAADSKKQHLKKREKRIEKMKSRYEENPAYYIQYRKSNREEISAKGRAHYQANIEHERERSRRFVAENPDYYRAYNAKRRAAKLERTVTGYDEELQLAYTWAQDANEFLEYPGFFEVDHEAALQAELVSGLHAPWNLAVIPASENRSKRNRFVPYAERYDSEGDVTEWYESPYEPEEGVNAA